MGTGGGAEDGEALDTVGLDVAKHGSETVVVLMLNLPDSGGDGSEGEVGAREMEVASPEPTIPSAGILDGSPAVSVDQDPVEEGVTEVGGDQGEGDGTDVIEGLQVAAQGEVEKQCWGSPVEGVEETDGSFHHLRVDRHAAHTERGELDQPKE